MILGVTDFNHIMVNTGSMLTNSTLHLSESNLILVSPSLIGMMNQPLIVHGLKYFSLHLKEKFVIMLGSHIKL